MEKQTGLVLRLARSIENEIQIEIRFVFFHQVLLERAEKNLRLLEIEMG